MTVASPTNAASVNISNAGATILFLLLLGNSAVAASSVTGEMEALLDSNQAARAFELGRSHPQPDDPDYDLWFGVAAMEIGKVSEGLAALTRHLARHPDHPQNPRAQVELGRGYYLIGDLARARKAFDAALKYNPPPEVAANIHRFLEMMDSSATTSRSNLAGFLELGIAPDSNVNGGVSDATVNLPVFGLTTLADAGVEQSATAGLASGGLNFDYALRNNLTAFASLRGDVRLYNVNAEFNQRGYTATGGLGWTTGRNLLRGTVLYNAIEIDNEPYRDLPLLGLEYSRQLDARSVAGASFQFGEIRYDGANELRDATLTSGAISYRRQLPLQMTPVIGLNAAYTDENNQRSRPDLGRSIWSLRAGADLTPLPQWQVGAGVTWQHSDYHASDPLLGVERDDDYVAVDLALRYQIMRNLSAKAEVLLSTNRSNLELYEYDRDTVAFTVRYDFD